MTGRYFPASPLISSSSGRCGRMDEFGYEISDADESSDTEKDPFRRLSRRTNSAGSGRSTRIRTFISARPWPCRPCGLILGTCHILLGVCIITFDVATNWITETAFAITAGICFVNSGIIGLIAARKLDRGSITLLVIFSFLSLGLCFILIIEFSAALNRACAMVSTEPVMFQEDHISGTNSPDASKCIGKMEVEVRAGILIVSLLESVVCIVSIIVGGKSLCGRYTPDLRNPSSPYQALIYGDLAPPQPPKRIVQDVGEERTNDKRERRMYSRLLLEYLVQSPGANQAAQPGTLR